MPTINGCHVPDRFADTLKLHVALNMIGARELGIPLILGIHGPSGDGKTFQTELVLKEMGISIVRVTPHELESAEAGAPARMISERYWEASQLGQDGAVGGAVMIIEDLDLGIGSWRDLTQYTVNTQLIVNCLMAIADEPTQVASRATVRVPIIATGNDLTRLYLPLLREGRTLLFRWTPTLEEKIEIVRKSIFPEGFLSDGDLNLLVDRYKHRPIAFFAQLRAQVTTRILANKLANTELPGVLARTAEIIHEGGEAKRLTADELVGLAEAIDANRPAGALITTENKHG